MKIGNIFVVGGLVGLVASILITSEKIKLISNPSYTPICNINPLISCGSVLATPQAAAFGFPNPILGLAGFLIVILIGLMQIKGVRFWRWVWLAIQSGVTLGLLFVHWLIYQSIFQIKALCLYCMVVWLAMILLFWYTTLHNLKEGGIKTLVQQYHFQILLLWYAAILGTILWQFWGFWQTVL